MKYSALGSLLQTSSSNSNNKNQNNKQITPPSYHFANMRTVQFYLHERVGLSSFVWDKHEKQLILYSLTVVLFVRSSNITLPRPQLGLINFSVIYLYDHSPVKVTDPLPGSVR